MRTVKQQAVRMRPRARKDAAAPAESNIVVFTSVDGTLLDPVTFEPGGSLALVTRLQGAGVPVVPVTIMTLEEMEPIAANFGFRHAMIVEGGGGIARWNGTSWDLEGWGPPAETLLDVVREIEDRSGADLIVYSVLPESEAERLSGLRGPMLRASMLRRFSEPFVIENGDVADVMKAAEAIGFTVRRGRRFFHLTRSCDVGEAYARVRDELRCGTAIAVGSSPVDAEFLARADYAVIGPRTDGSVDPDLAASVRGARIAPVAGPDGWVSAVEETIAALAERAGCRRGA